MTISSQLKEVFTSKGVSTKGGTVTLATWSHPVQTTLGIKVKPEPFFSSEVMTRLQVKLGVSDRKLLEAAYFLRIHYGRGSVVNLESQLYKRNHLLEAHFTSRMIPQKKTFTDETSDENRKKVTAAIDVEKPAVFSTDVEGLAALIMDHRGLSPETSVIQLGVDLGEDLLKIMMTVKDKNEKTNSCAGKSKV